MSIKEKTSYLKGLFEAYGIAKTQDKKESKILLAILDALDAVASDLEELKRQQDELEEYVEKIDDDLTDLEDTMLEDEDEDEDEDEPFDEIECPHCGELVCIDDNLKEDGSLTCPACGKKIDLG